MPPETALKPFSWRTCPSTLAAHVVRTRSPRLRELANRGDTCENSGTHTERCGQGRYPRTGQHSGNGQQVRPRVEGESTARPGKISNHVPDDNKPFSLVKIVNTTFVIVISDVTNCVLRRLDYRSTTFVNCRSNDCDVQSGGMESTFTRGNASTIPRPLPVLGTLVPLIPLSHLIAASQAL